MAVGGSPSIELNLVELRASQNFANANKKLPLMGFLLILGTALEYSSQYLHSSIS